MTFNQNCNHHRFVLLVMEKKYIRHIVQTFCPSPLQTIKLCLNRAVTKLNSNPCPIYSYYKLVLIVMKNICTNTAVKAVLSNILQITNEANVNKANVESNTRTLSSGPTRDCNCQTSCTLKSQIKARQNKKQSNNNDWKLF